MNTTVIAQNQRQQIARRIAKKGKGWAFTPRDFMDIADPGSVGMVLTRMMRDGKIRRLSRGIYDRPMRHPLLEQSGAGVASVVQAIVRARNLRCLPSPAMAANQLGLTTQVPAQIVYHVDAAPFIIQLGKLKIRFRRASGKTLVLAGQISGLIAQALRFFGKSGVPEDAVGRLQKCLDKQARQQLSKDLDKFPVWMQHYVKLVLADHE